MTTVKASLFILYVRDQQVSADFYRAVLAAEPTLHVPGMTEFALTDNSTLGLMPSSGIKKLLGDKLPDPERAEGIPRAELYLTVDDPQAYVTRALNAGATELSPLQLRGWGDNAAYVMDPDCHVVAFASRG